jgi:hypothetical protein
MGRHDVLLARVPEELAEHARAVIDWLVGDVIEFTEVGQADVQRLLWIDLPSRWPTPSTEWLKVAEATAVVFQLAGRPSLAELARSEETAEILAAYARSVEDGLLAANAAYARTGTNPPDTDLLTWGRRLSAAEGNAYDELQRVLEAAVIADEYAPGASGWRQKQRALTDRWLTSPSQLFEGMLPLEVIHTERRETWSETGEPTRIALLGPIAEMLVEAPEVPEDEPASLRWLLGRIGDGVRLTQRGYLPTELVRAADDKFGWSPAGVRPASESQLPPLLELHELVRSQRLVTKRRSDLKLSARGRAQLLEPPRLFETASVAWLGSQLFEIMVNEIPSAMLLGHPADSRTMCAVAHEAVSPSFRDRDGEPVRFSDTEFVVWGWIRRGLALGFLQDLPRDSRYALTDSGESAALCALRSRAHGPQT